MAKKEAVRLSDHFTFARLARFTLPSVAMMIFTSIYSVVDGFFVSNFAGKGAFSALNLIMPVLMILCTLGMMLGAGGTALVAKTLGQGDKDRANRIFSLLIYTALIAGTALAAAGFLLMPRVAFLLGAREELLANCVVYGRIYLLGLPFMILMMMFQTFYPAAEKPRLGFLVTLGSGVSNMILDALLCTLLPAEGRLAGAAGATAFSQFAGAVFSLAYFSIKKDGLLRLGKTRFDGKALLKACFNGSSEFMTSISMSVVSMLYNGQLMQYAGEDGVAAYGVLMYVGMIFTAAFVGYSMGVSPPISFHHGAENTEELKNLLKKSLVICLAGGGAMALFGELFAPLLSRLFVGYDEGLYRLTLSGFRIVAVTYFFVGFCIFGSGFFTALNDGVTSAAIAFLRTVVFEIAFILLLPRLFGINGVWISCVAADATSFLLVGVFLFAKRKRYGLTL